MVTGTDKIQLELVVDRPTLERELGQVFSTNGRAPGAPLSAGGGRAGEGAKVSAGPSFSRLLTPLVALTGISLGITALVRGSQVMSTTVGALNTTLSALVDSFLAPLAPYLIKMVDLAAKLFPTAEVAGAEVAQKVGTVAAFIKGEPPKEAPEATRAAILKEGGRRILDLFQIMGGQLATGRAPWGSRPLDPAAFGELEQRTTQRQQERMGIATVTPLTARLAETGRQQREARTAVTAGLGEPVGRVREERAAPTYNINVYGTDTEEAVRELREALESTKRLSITRTSGGR